MYPAYRPDLSLCDLHIFDILEKTLKDYMFKFDCDVQDAMV